MIAIYIVLCMKFADLYINIFALQEDSTKVLARFDLNRTWQHFIIFFGVPSVLFVVSFVSLCIITRSVNVGDDAKMRCKYCMDENSDIDDIDEIANKCVQRLNAIEEAVNEQENVEQPSTSKVIPRRFFYSHSYIFTEPFFSRYSHTINNLNQHIMNQKQRPVKPHMKNKTHQEQSHRQ